MSEPRPVPFHGRCVETRSDDTPSASVLYLCGGRSFFTERLNRKLAEVARCWRASGHYVRHVGGGDILPSEPEGGNYGSQETHDRWYRRGGVLRPIVTSASEWRDIRHDQRLLRHLEIDIDNWRPDVVWERSARLHDAGLRLARRLGVPYVLEWKDHLVDYRHSLFRRLALTTEARKNRQADFIVVESAVLRDALGRDGVDREKIIVAHNAVDAAEFTADRAARARIRADLRIDEETVLVGYLGSYAFYHDTERLVRAAALVRARAPEVKILMMGAGQQYQASRELAGALGLLDGTLIMKPGVPKEDVPGVLSALDIAVLPGSTDIICPIKVQEYMAAGLPSIVPDYACNREVVGDGETGHLFKPRDEVDLSEKIIFLANDPAMREQTGRRAREVAERRFSWEATWGAALEAVLERSTVDRSGPAVS